MDLGPAESGSNHQGRTIVVVVTNPPHDTRGHGGSHDTQTQHVAHAAHERNARETGPQRVGLLLNTTIVIVFRRRRLAGG